MRGCLCRFIRSMSEVSFDVLLAKSGASEQGGAVTVADHCVEVADCAAAIVEATGSEFAAFFGLDVADEARLGSLLRVAALLHDVGKAGGSFQAQMHGRGGQRGHRHPFFHEWLSVAVCLQADGLGSWIHLALPDRRGRAAVLAAVMGHHVRTPPTVPEARVPCGEVVYLDHPSLVRLWQELASGAHTAAVPDLERVVLTKTEWEDLLFEYLLFVQRVVGAAGSQPARASLVALAACCKAALIAADTVASAQIRGRGGPARWAKNALQERLSVSDLEQIVRTRLGGQAPYRFQQVVAASDDRVTLVEAGCGSGKTLAAYMWARRHATGKRLMFCYPTTGTTSAGFQDYLLAQSDLERALMHSRASADIDEILDNGGADDEDGSLWIADVLDLWGKKVVACTVDSVLSLLACWRRALAASPVFAQSAFVFDEVHSYDEHLFGAFLAFLRWTRGSCLVMTASLSDARRAAIEHACGQRIEPIRGEPAAEDAPRYRIAQVRSGDVARHVEEARESGGKVLYVANTVARATAAFDRLAPHWGPRARLYHSRFRYEDRVGIQARVLELFRSPGPAFVAATQVCEMSLDISATLLISELAPFPSLVQRLGRLNRRRDPEGARLALVVAPKDPLPYARKELSAAREMLAPLVGRDTSQRDLAHALAGMADGPYEERIMPLISPHDVAGTKPGMLRSGSVSFPVVREEDLSGSWDRVTRSELIRLTIPMLRPKGHDVRHWRRLRGTTVAPRGSVRYDRTRGAWWRN